MYSNSLCKMVIRRFTLCSAERRSYINHFRKKFVTLLCLLIFASSTESLAQCLKDLTDSRSVTITALTAEAGYLSPKAFDNDDDAYGGWLAQHNPEPGNACWLRVQFNSGAEIIKGYSVSSFDDNSGNNNKAPADWELQASNDGSAWTTLDVRSGQIFGARGETHIYSFSNASSYVYYRLYFTQTNLASSTQIAISEIQLFEDVCLTGTVFQDGGDRAQAYNPATDIPISGIPVRIITSPAGNVFATTTTDVNGGYYFSSAQIPSTGSFSVIMRPPAAKIFATFPATLWSSHVVLPSAEEEPPTGAVFFDYHLTTTTNVISGVNRMRFAGGNLDFGLSNAVPAPVFACDGSSTNMITEANGGTFGVSAYTWEIAHPHQKSFTYSGDLYSSIPASCTDYIFNSTSATTGGGRGVLYDEGRYAVMSFPGTLSDIAYAPFMNQMLNNVSGGWRKSYGTTTADVNDKFLAVNGATTGSLPFFKQTNLTLVPAGQYTIAFYGKQANSYAQGALADAQVVIEVLDRGNTVVTSGSLLLNRPVSFVEDRPEAPWQLRFFSFTAPGDNGPYTVQLRASTTAAVGNDFYIDDIVLYPCTMGILPLHLSGFNVIPDKNENVRINWIINNAVPGTAEIQYSRDGKTFVSSGFVSIKAGQTNYSFIHYRPGTDIHYYRLKISDAQDRITYSAIKNVEIKSGKNEMIHVYPNPVSDKIFIQTSEVMDAADIIDLSGKSIRKFSKQDGSGFTVNTEDIAAGIYYIRLIKKQNVSLHKIIIHR